MSDPFLTLERPERVGQFPCTRNGSVVPALPARSAGNHSERAHSKFSASGAERWFQCPGSVELSEGLPDKSSPWAIEGTKAHEVLEVILLAVIKYGIDAATHIEIPQGADRQMVFHAMTTARVLYDLWVKTPGSDISVETRIYLDFIHPEMFGTFDGAVIDYWGTLHVFDYKYGAGTFVTPKDNLQMIFYAVGLAALHHWNFKQVRMWIVQPRVKGYDGPLFWDVTVPELKRYVDLFRKAVDKVLAPGPPVYREGSWCHWCRAKSVCPLKRASKLEQAKSVFSIRG